MRTIASSDLKEQCLELLAEAGEDGIVIMHGNRPVARLVAIQLDRPGNMSKHIGALKGRVGIKGDIFSTGLKWDAES